MPNESEEMEWCKTVKPKMKWAILSLLSLFIVFFFPGVSLMSIYLFTKMDG